MSVPMSRGATGNKSAAARRAENFKLVPGLSRSIPHDVQTSAAIFGRILGDPDSVIQDLKRCSLRFAVQRDENFTGFAMSRRVVDCLLSNAVEVARLAFAKALSLPVCFERALHSLQPGNRFRE